MEFGGRCDVVMCFVYSIINVLKLNKGKKMNWSKKYGRISLTESPALGHDEYDNI